MERLADDGWREEIISHRQEYLRCIGRMEGACVARPLVGKGTGAQVMEMIYNLRTIFSVGQDEGPGTPGNVPV